MEPARRHRTAFSLAAFALTAVAATSASAQFACPKKSGNLVFAQEAKVTDRDSIDTTALQLSGDSYREVLIEIEASPHRQRASPLAVRTAGFGDESGRQFPVCVRSSRTGRHRSEAD